MSIVDAPVPSGWPARQPLAVSVSVMLEGWAEGSAPGIGPIGNPLKPGVPDLQALSWAEYGPKAGAWRLLDLLDREGVRAVFYTSGVVAERYPDLPAAIAMRGHVVAAHGWSQGTLPPYLTGDAEQSDIIRCVDVLSRTAGRHPHGWLSPRCTPSAMTSRLLVHSGFRWHADMFDADLPYWIATEDGSLLGMPFTMEVNDMPLYVRYGNEPEAFSRTLARILAGWGSTGQSVRLPRHYRPRPHIRQTVRRDRVARRDRTGSAVQPLLADRSRATGGAVSLRCPRNSPPRQETSWQYS